MFVSTRLATVVSRFHFLFDFNFAHVSLFPLSIPMAFCPTTYGDAVHLHCKIMGDEDDSGISFCENAFCPGKDDSTTPPTRAKRQGGPVSLTVDRLTDIATSNDAVFMSVIGLIVLVSLLLCFCWSRPWQLALFKDPTDLRRRRLRPTPSPPSSRPAPGCPSGRAQTSDYSGCCPQRVLCLCSLVPVSIFLPTSLQIVPMGRENEDLGEMRPLSASLEDLPRDPLPLRAVRVRMPLDSPHFVTTSRILRENLSR